MPEGQAEKKPKIIKTMYCPLMEIGLAFYVFIEIFMLYVAY